METDQSLHFALIIQRKIRLYFIEVNIKFFEVPRILLAPAGSVLGLQVLRKVQDVITHTLLLAKAISSYGWTLSSYYFYEAHLSPFASTFYANPFSVLQFVECNFGSERPASEIQEKSLWCTEVRTPLQRNKNTCYRVRKHEMFCLFSCGTGSSFTVTRRTLPYQQRRVPRRWQHVLKLSLDNADYEVRWWCVRGWRQPWSWRGFTIAFLSAEFDDCISLLMTCKSQ